MTGRPVGCRERAVQTLQAPRAKFTALCAWQGRVEDDEPHFRLLHRVLNKTLLAAQVRMARKRRLQRADLADAFLEHARCVDPSTGQRALFDKMQVADLANQHHRVLSRDFRVQRAHAGTRRPKRA